MKKSMRKMYITFLSPIIILFLVIQLYPTLQSFYLSFFKVPGLSSNQNQWSFVGFNNFKELFSRQLFIISVQNVTVIMFLGGIVVFTFALFFAWVLHRGMIISKFWKHMIYLPSVITPIAMVVVWTQYAFNNQYGLLKTVFDAIGLHQLAAIPWTSTSYSFWAMFIAYCFGSVGGQLIIYIAAMGSIPKDLFEAAYMDGARESHTFFRITLPLIRDAIKTQIIFWGLGCVNFFLWSRVFSVNTIDPATVAPANYMYDLIFGSASANTVTPDPNVGLGTAVGICLCLASIILFAVVNLLFGKEKYEY
jgi:ABC-type sugar transport system permease subunit